MEATRIAAHILKSFEKELAPEDYEFLKQRLLKFTQEALDNFKYTAWNIFLQPILEGENK